MGRWEKPNSVPLHLRIYSVCNALEDEFHFVCECKVYNQLRNCYIPDYYNIRRNMHICIQLFTCENDPTLKNLCLYL